MKVIKIALIMAVISSTSCFQLLNPIKSSGRLTSITGVSTAGALNIAETVVNKMTLALVATYGLSQKQAVTLAHGALQLLEQKQSGTGLTLTKRAYLFLSGSAFDPCDITQVAPTIMQGMMAAMTETDAGLGDDTSKLNAVKGINSSLFVSIKDNLAALNANQRQLLPGTIAQTAVANLSSGGISAAAIGSGINTIMSSTITTLGAAGYAATELSGTITAVTKGGIQGLGELCDGGNISATQVADLSYNVVSTAISNLSNAGIIDVNIIQSISIGVTSTALSATMSVIAGNADKDAILNEASKMITSGTMSALGGIAGINSDQLQAAAQAVMSNAIATVYTGAQTYGMTFNTNITANMSAGMYDGLAAAGLPSATINTYSQIITNSVQNGLAGTNVDINNYTAAAQTGLTPMPTIDPIAPVAIAATAGTGSVNLTGITDGGAGGKTLTVTASTNSPTIITNISVAYVSPSTTGTLSFTLGNVASAAAIPAIIFIKVDNGRSFTTNFIVNFSQDTPPNQTVAGANPTVKMLMINGGAPSTTTTNVVLFSDAANVTQIYITAMLGCTGGGSWQTYFPEGTPWILPQTNAMNTVYAKFRNANLVETSCVGASIMQDSAPASDPVVGLVGGGTTAKGSTVPLTISSTGATQMYITNTPGCIMGGVWEPYATMRVWNLASSSGPTAVYVRTKDLAGTPSSCVNFSITISRPYSLTTGGTFACLKGPTGAVNCWGNSSSGQIGQGISTTYGRASGQNIANSIAVNLGTSHTALVVAAGKTPYGFSDSETSACALLNDNTVKCWGANGNGELGIGTGGTRGTLANEMGDNLSTVDFGAGITAAAISVGGHACAILSGSNNVKCWGNNDYGQLGLGDTINRGDGNGLMGSSLNTVNLGSGRTATQIVAGPNHTCAILDNQSLKCWGNNPEGELGLGFSSPNMGSGSNQMGDNLPTVDLGTGKYAVAVALGGFHSCALLNDGSVKCWGYNDNGQLGQNDDTVMGVGSTPGTMGDNLPAVPLGIGRIALQIAVGNRHSCALLDNGTVKCWGMNNRGQLGQGNTITLGTASSPIISSTPAINLSGKIAVAVATGDNYTCVLLSNDSVTCFGDNTYGQLDIGSSTVSYTTGSPLYMQHITPLRLFVAQSVGGGNMGGPSGADSLCNASANNPLNGSTYKAVIVDSLARHACTSSNCATSGLAENLNWVLMPNTTYMRPDTTLIGTTTNAAIFTGTLTNSFIVSGLEIWSGQTGSWTASSTCTNWTSTGGTGYVGNSSNTAVSSAFYVYAQNCDRTDASMLCAEQP